MKIGSVFVTGANRGIGLEFVRQLARLGEPPDYIFATYRNAEGLQELKSIEESSTKSQIVLIKMDVTDSDEVEVAKQMVEEKVGEKGLNLLINNAGMAQVQSFPDVTQQNMQLHFRVNTIGPVMVFQALLPLLKKAAICSGASEHLSVSRASVLNITSLAGSIFNTGQTFTQDLVVPSYKTSKAALNMVMRVIAAEVKAQGILVLLMCPGYVKTDMTMHAGEIEVEQSISDMITTLAMMDETNHGQFTDRLGNRYPF